MKKNKKKKSQEGAAALRQRQQTKRMGEDVVAMRSSRGESCVSQYCMYYYICALLLYTDRMGGMQVRGGAEDENLATCCVNKNRGILQLLCKKTGKIQCKGCG